MVSKVLDEIAYPFPNFNGCTAEVWEWIYNFIPHFIMDIITYPCWNENSSISLKWGHLVWLVRNGDIGHIGPGMAYCLTTWSYYMNLWWLPSDGALWHSPDCNCTIHKLLCSAMGTKMFLINAPHSRAHLLMKKVTIAKPSYSPMAAVFSVSVRHSVRHIDVLLGIALAGGACRLLEMHKSMNIYNHCRREMHYHWQFPSS